VSDDFKSRLAELRAKGDQALIDFLRADLDLGLTFVRLSQIERGLDEPASKQARFNAEQVIETVKNFRNRLKDDERAREIEQRLAELESLVSATHY
jgi:hypothetical protein